MFTMEGLVMKMESVMAPSPTQRILAMDPFASLAFPGISAMS
jgi:hypothetical protein